MIGTELLTSKEKGTQTHPTGTTRFILKPPERKICKDKKGLAEADTARTESSNRDLRLKESERNEPEDLTLDWDESLFANPKEKEGCTCHRVRVEAANLPEKSPNTSAEMETTNVVLWEE